MSEIPGPCMPGLLTAVEESFLALLYWGKTDGLPKGSYYRAYLGGLAHNCWRMEKLGSAKSPNLGPKICSISQPF